MAYEISVNLDYAFQDAGERIEQRIDAAAAAGFRKVELFLLKGRCPSSEHSAQIAA